MSWLAVLWLTAAVEPRVQTVLDAIAEPGCPRLYSMLTPGFQQAYAAGTWPAWCRSVGALKDLESLGTRDGWLLFRGSSGERRILLDVVFSPAGKVAGLMARHDKSQPVSETKLSLEDQLARVREANRLPGLSVLVVRDGKVAEVAAVGVRKQGDPTAVTAEDRWHLGSDTKAMTATLAAILVEEKRISWSSTVGKILSNWKGLHPRARKLTLEMLLAHRAGIPAAVSPSEWGRMWRARDPVKQRKETVRRVLRAAPGETGKYLYSNIGYMVAGVMLEKVSKLSWEKAIRKKLFEPLQMSSCGFGAPGTPGKVDQPWGHERNDASLVPQSPGPKADNPAALGPAGTVHCGLRDWARFVVMHIEGARGKSTLIAPASMTRLHTPPAGGDYALGWATDLQPKGGKTLSHDGSNTLSFARVWMMPSRNLAFLIAANAAGPDATGAADRLLDYLRAKYAN